eukprot:TRINITY_DN294_c1_g2_i1.p1 TRINITY_DN294_c1_g2~~TRINITY_DN294_c1_g2_i1.p1  ORF type:complete len:1360 (+),score=290.67 TRINITY_DN294_c1_g2_i1:96-4082(+)
MPPKGKAKKATVPEELHLEMMEKERLKLQEKQNEISELQRDRAELRNACAALEAAATEARAKEERRRAEERTRQRELAEARFRKEAERRREQRADSQRLSSQHAVMMRQENALHRAEAEADRLWAEVTRLRDACELREREALEECVARLHREVRTLRVRQSAVDCRSEELAGLLAGCRWRLPTPRRAVVIAAVHYDSPLLASRRHAAADAAEVAGLLRARGFAVDLLLSNPEAEAAAHPPAAAADAGQRVAPPAAPHACVKAVREASRANILRTIAEAAAGQNGEQQLLVWLSLHAVRHSTEGLLLLPSDARLPEGAGVQRRGEAADFRVAPELALISLCELCAAAGAHGGAVPRAAVIADTTAPLQPPARPQGGHLVVWGTGSATYAAEYLPQAGAPLGGPLPPLQPAGLLTHALCGFTRGNGASGQRTVAGLVSLLDERKTRQGVLPRWPCRKVDPSTLLPPKASWPATAPRPAASVAPAAEQGAADEEEGQGAAVVLCAPVECAADPGGNSLVRLPMPLATSGSAALVAAAAPPGDDSLSSVLVTLHLACDQRLAPLVLGGPRAAARVPAAVRRARSSLREWAEAYFGQAAGAWLRPEARGNSEVTWISGSASHAALGARLGPLARLSTAHAACAVELQLRSPSGTRRPRGSTVPAAALRELLQAGLPDPSATQPPPRHLVWSYMEECVEGAPVLIVVYVPRPVPLAAALPSDIEKAAKCPAVREWLPKRPGPDDGVVEFEGCPASALLRASEGHAEIYIGQGERWAVAECWLGLEATVALPEAAAHALDLAARSASGRIAPPPPQPAPPPPDPTELDVFRVFCSRRGGQLSSPKAAAPRSLPAPTCTAVVPAEGPPPPRGPFRVRLAVEGAAEQPKEALCGHAEDGAPPLRDPLPFRVPAADVQPDGVLVAAEVWDADGARIGSGQGLLKVDAFAPYATPARATLWLHQRGRPAPHRRSAGALHLRWYSTGVSCAQHCAELAVQCTEVIPPPAPVAPPPSEAELAEAAGFTLGQLVELDTGGATWVAAYVRHYDGSSGLFSVEPVAAAPYSPPAPKPPAEPIQPPPGLISASPAQLRSPGTATEWKLWAALAADDIEKTVCREEARKQNSAEAAEAAAAAASGSGPHEVELRGVVREEWVKCLNTTPPAAVRRAAAAAEMIVIFGFAKADPSAHHRAALCSALYVAKGYVLEARHRTLAGRSTVAFFSFYSGETTSGSSPPTIDAAITQPPAPGSADLGLEEYCPGVTEHLISAAAPSVVACDLLCGRSYWLRAGAAVFRNGGSFDTAVVRRFVDCVRQGELSGLGSPAFEMPETLRGQAVSLI